MEELKILIKIVAILVGWLLVLGGGICTASNIFFAATIPGGYRGAFGFLLVISLVAAGIGWLLLKSAGVFRRKDDATTGQRSGDDSRIP